MAPSQTYSILCRLRRMTTAYAYVRVPVTGSLVVPAGDSGRAEIVPDRLWAADERLGADPELCWVREVIAISLHPTQTPLPADYPLRPVVSPPDEPLLVPEGGGA